jgi:nicotinamidase-related amidase
VEPYVTPQNLDEKTASWLKTIQPYNQHVMDLRSPRSALLVIDMQRFFLDAESPTFTCGGLSVLPKVQGLVEAFRAAGRPVLFTRHVHHPDHLDSGIMAWWWSGMCLEGDPLSDLHPSLAPRPSEKVVLKHRYSAFYNTDLETVLRCLDVTDLVVCGLMTNLCCESTARDAYYRDYRVFFLADATGSVDEELHLASLRNLAFGFAYVTTAQTIASQLTRS